MRIGEEDGKTDHRTAAHMKPIPSDVADVAQNYLALTDERLPDRLIGFYLVGSIALGDYRHGQSDLDFVSVIDSPLTAKEMATLSGIHKLLARRGLLPKLDGIYVTADQLLSAPDSLVTPCCRSGKFSPGDGFAANPVTWFVLSRYPRALRGPEKPAVCCNEAQLRMWCANNLREYWSPWVQRACTTPLRMLYSLSSQAIVWGVLGVVRLHATITTGGILSKSEAADYAVKSFAPHWSKVVCEASNIRERKTGSLYASIFARRSAALSFMRFVILDAAARAASLHTPVRRGEHL